MNEKPNEEIIKAYENEYILLHLGIRKSEKQIDRIHQEIVRRNIDFDPILKSVSNKIFTMEQSQQERLHQWIEANSPKPPEIKPEPKKKKKVDKGVPYFEDYETATSQLRKVLKTLTEHRLITISGHSMKNVGYRDGDLVIYDPKGIPRHGDIVIVVLDGYWFIKRYIVISTGIVFGSENEEYEDFEPSDYDEFIIKGVVKTKIDKQVPKYIDNKYKGR